MWDEVRAGIGENGVFVSARLLSADVVQHLIDAFDSESAEKQSTAARQKRGVVFARRNLLSLKFIREFVDGDDMRLLVRELCPGSTAVRGILFDKTGDANWTVPWHQDRSIAVKEKRDVAGFGPWSVKAGVHHVQPPVELLHAMLTFRFSLDACDADNGPLRAIERTHHHLLSAAEVDAAVAAGRETVCTTGAGGAVIMRPLLLHASSPARQVRRRRVLHLELGPVDLPAGLRWAKS